MDHVINSWKNKNVAEKQLKLNLIEISNIESYPKHWKSFIFLTKNINPKTMLDIGCGCGTYYMLCKNELPEIKYTGIDYSEDMITLAKSTWGYDDFYVKSYLELTEEYLKGFDLIHMGALLDILPNGDEALNFILSLKPKNVLLGRVKLTDKNSYYDVYTAYDEIETFAYHHNTKSFLNICKNNNYEIINIEDNFHLKLII
jgi:trans-aconitate methyltransferase